MAGAGSSSGGQPDGASGGAAGQDPGEDGAVAAIEMMGGLINNADGKVGILGAAMVVLGGAMLSQRDRVGDILRHDLGARAVVALVLLGVAVVALVAAAVQLFLAVQPRVPDEGASRFSFLRLADASIDDLLAASPDDLRRDAWLQATTLARIARAKFRGFAIALRAAAAAAALFALWCVVYPD